ncbi:hypothetical protein BZZ01_04805 [Nostocales cyanobacterium HT-58-2]|nr:hypothetical protein BZZ01_04805 [Nostocales cyanobacterium HT-58-2]
MSLAIIGKVNSLKRQREQRRKRRQEKLNAQGTVPYAKYADDPVGFCSEILEIAPTPEQISIMESVRDRPITNVKAAHGVGKSLTAAVLVLWYVFAVGGVAITTAPSEDQVKDILWHEVRKLYDKHKKKLGGERGVLFVRLSETARAWGFTSRNYDVNSFQGKHEEKMLLIEDEADGITEIIDDGFRSCLTGSRNRGLRIGNPVDPLSNFAKTCKKDRHCITITAFSHPNTAWAYERCADGVHRLKPEVAARILNEDGEIKPQDKWDEDLPRDVIPGAISIEWIETVRRDKFENSPFWISRVLGEYPEDSTDGIIPLRLLRAARARYDANPEYWEELAKRYTWRLGLDVGDGGDPHALAIWRGPVLYEVQIHPTKGDLLDTDRAADIAEENMRSLGGHCEIAVDSTGVGAGTLARLIKSGRLARACRFGDGAKKPKLYTNRKAELFWNFREALKSEELAIAPLENEDYVFADLAATRYTTNTKDQILCEPKEKTRSRWVEALTQKQQLLPYQFQSWKSRSHRHLRNTKKRSLGS